MKIGNLVRAMAIAFAAWVVPAVGMADVTIGGKYADGSIVDIRAVDGPGMRFGDRNRLSGDLCSPDNPLVAGETLCIRVRLQVTNATLVAVNPDEAPQTWRFWDVANGRWAADGEGPKLGLLIGNRPAYADYSLDGLEFWQQSGELKTDDNGAVTGDYRYYTDLYFKYKVQSGDIGLPVRLMNTNYEAPSPTERSSVEYAFQGLNVGSGAYLLMNETGVQANLCFAAGGLMRETAWPIGPWTDDPTHDGPILNYDLSAEGVYMKTVGFDDRWNYDMSGSWSEGQDWRHVEIGRGLWHKGPDTAKIRVVGDVPATEDTTVYLWSGDESVFTVTGPNQKRMNIGTADSPTNVNVVTVTIYRGSAESADGAFELKCAAGATTADRALLNLTSTKGVVSYDAAGTPRIVALSRPIGVEEASPTAVKIRIDDYTTTMRSVVAGPGYQMPVARVHIVADGPLQSATEISFKAAIKSGPSTLQAIYNQNIIRLQTNGDGLDPEAPMPSTKVRLTDDSRVVTFYVYALGATDDSRDNGVRFTLDKASLTGDTTVVVDETAATLKVVPQGDEGIAIFATDPAAEKHIKDTEGAPKAQTIKFKFADSYKNYRPRDNDPDVEDYPGYTFWYTPADESAEDYGKIYLFKDGVIPKTDNTNQWIEVKGKFDGRTDDPDEDPVEFPKGTYEFFLYGVAPDGSTTEKVRFFVDVVGDTKYVDVNPSPVRIGEGEKVSYKVTVGEKRSGSYIFFKGKTAADDALVSSDIFYTKGVGSGAPLEGLEVTELQDVTFLDGREGNGTEVNLKAYLTDSNDPDDPVGGWKAGDFRVYVTNKPPVVKTLTVAGIRNLKPSTDNGKTLNAVPCGVPKEFGLTASDVAADIETLDIMWTIGDGRVVEKKGVHPTNANFTVTFDVPSPGLAVEVYVKDKDMEFYPDMPNFHCTLPVVKQPNVSISTLGTFSDIFNESSSAGSQKIVVTLSEQATTNIEVKLTVGNPTDGNGYIRFQHVPGQVETNEEANVYTIKFAPPSVTRRELTPLKYDGMDGTIATAPIIINAEVTTTATNSDGIAWKDFYQKADAYPITVQNDSPVFDRPSLQEAFTTNGNASINTPYPIRIQAHDVPADLTTPWVGNTSVSGLLFSVSIDGTALTNGYLTSTGYVDVNAEFESSGPHVVIVRIEDKDGGFDERAVVYDVQPSKVLKVYPVGPGPAVSTLGGSYANYPGIGAGRVYAGTLGPQKVENFIHTYSFLGTQESVDLWAFGYLADGKADDGNLVPSPDLGIDRYGNWAKGKDIEENYNYALHHKYGLAGYDSFMYGWVGGTASDEGEVQEEFFSYLRTTGYRSVNLPSGSNGDSANGQKPKSYPLQKWEAVFSREYLKSDNCGDINVDGIPDLVLFTYGLGVVDPITKAISGDEGDLADVSDYNHDENKNPRGYEGESSDGDFLPTEDIAEFGSMIPALIGKWEKPFTAILEIRGAGVSPDGSRHLNDAFAPEFPDGAVNRLAFPEVTSDRHYTDPYTSPTSTLSYVEWLAWQEYAAAKGLTVDDPEHWKLWSPERPTLPTKTDTDGDGFPDGYEYYYWYRAHVGYMDGGVHRRLTGRAYDPRNPGEGIFISAEQIETAMDPIVAAGDIEQDTDNDGLPDLLEMLIGTNPFDFDTDGDGLPDGFEIIVAGTDPLTDHTAKDAKHDAARNYDGDAMAFTTVTRESGVLPLPRFIQKYYTFATVDPAGDTDGIQWYVETPLDGGVSAFTYTNGTPVAGVKFTAGGVDYVTTNGLALADGRLAATLEPSSTFVATNVADAAKALRIAFDESVEWVILRPARVPAGTPVSETNAVTCANAAVLDLAAKDDCNAAWVYGNRAVSNCGEEFGFLAFSRYQLPNEGDIVAELPTMDRDVAFLHYLVYQQWGFDPRTAWSAKTPLSKRWSEGGYEGQTANKLGYAGQSTRTRAFTAYDEFLLYSFFLNNGCDMSGYTEADAEAPYLAKVWMAFCTNPRGAGEPEWASDKHYQGWTAHRDENGCDTDGDGVPDGWELYVMAGPKFQRADKVKVFNFAPPYAGFWAVGDDKQNIATITMPKSYFSPFVDYASDSATDNKIYIGKDKNEGLTERDEFVGTDSCAWYDEVQDGETVPYAVTPLLPDGWTWLNKFFPTDPWVPDTDDDGVKDNAERDAFAYAEAADVEAYKQDKSKTVFPGCGLNPLSVDTDMDGLPDGWENQFAGSTVSTNSAWGYIDGMDGTVSDAQTLMDGPNRDYDRDGLENWQEYLTGTMRCWRYDDPFTQWGSIPFEAYYCVNEDTGACTFQPDFKLLGIRGETEKDRWNTFWYETLEHVGGPIYNPHLIFGQSPEAQFFSRVDKGWDPNYWDMVLKGSADEAGSGDSHYYWFAHRIGNTRYTEAWGAVYGNAPFGKMEPASYVSCSPLVADSDHDGMDDYYELFHGLNPLLGGDYMPRVVEPCDRVRACGAEGKPGPATYDFNPWTELFRVAEPRGTNPAFDFVAFPWKNGLQTVDADGDNVRNYIESIMARYDSGAGHHSDPTPLWMTDSSYSNSLTRLHYRMPSRFYRARMNAESKVTDRNGESVFGFTGPDGKAYFFRDYDSFDMANGANGELEIFSVDRWKVGSDQIDTKAVDPALRYDRRQEVGGGWMFSFEENEGYDTDHDGLNDEAEIAGRAHGATDPIDFDSPRRRQAMYFPGEDSALQTPLEKVEAHPILGQVYIQEFPFREYTVECWVRPDDIRNATVVERAIWSAGANAGDRDLVRKNFQLAIRTSGGKGYWFTKFDSSGTGLKVTDEVSVLGAEEVVPGAWTHLAATFDGTHLTLFVNGKPSGTAADTTQSKQQPECGASVVDTDFADGRPIRTIGYGYSSLVVGASVKTYEDCPGVDFTRQICGFAINLYNAMGWDYYRDFFKGYVDEIRIWDGARTVGEIAGSMGVRYDAGMAKENRQKVYEQWREGRSRYGKDENGNDYTGVDAELRYHFTFDALLAADNAKALAKVPTGFGKNGAMAPYVRPDGYEIVWWKDILDAYGSAYAGATNYVTWIPNTVAHLPRFDGTTLDSAYWSADFAGDVPGTYRFARTAEPYSLWRQYVHGGEPGDPRSTLLRYYLANSAEYATTGFLNLFLFTGRNLLCEGCDLLPLGGAYARYCEEMWDGQGPSTVHEITGNDGDGDGLPDWWQEYAEQNYREGVPKGEDISWNTVIGYRIGDSTVRITAGEAYLRDLAKGVYLDDSGEFVIGPTKYLQVADEDANGIPDWWASLYGIVGESGLDDHDNDGLPNYVEYLLSEVFNFDVVFNPVRADSVQRGIPDYFYRPAGCQLYVGEIFTDHDRMYDTWEDQYPVKQVSRLAFDAYGDPDGDGWSNVSEMLAGTDPTRVSTLIFEGIEKIDFPIPTVELTLSRPAKAAGSNDMVVVEAWQGGDMTGEPDAVWTTASDSSGEKSKFLGRNTGGEMTFSCGPGSVVPGSFRLSFKDPTADSIEWNEDRTVIVQSLKVNESANVWADSVLDMQHADGGTIGDVVWRNTGDTVIGTIDYQTGFVTVDLSKIAGWNWNTWSDETHCIRTYIDKSYLRADWSSKMLKKSADTTLYLSEADKGALREGKYSFIAWADKDGSGTWQPGEPYGIVRDVDVSWRGTTAAIELTDMSSVTPRILLAGGSESSSGGASSGGSGESSVASEDDPSSDRRDTSVAWILQDAIAHNATDRTRLENNRIETVSLTPGSFKGQRIRVVRWLINDVPVRAAGTTPYVVLDKRIETDVRSCFTEADVLGGNENAFDLDWANLYRDVIDDEGVWSKLGGEVTRMCYLIVVGDGDVGWDLSTSTNVVRALPTAIVRKFGENRVTPVAVAPGAQVEETVHSANPTFKWTMDCPEEEGYTAFNVQVMDGSTVVWDSGKQFAPPRNDKGQYEWSAPLYAGDKTLKGKVFENKKTYTWKVEMYNAKFSQTGGYGNAGRFFLEVQTNGYAYGSANVAVRYFGPTNTWSKKNPDIRVRAYTSPDFTGLPVAAGYVAAQDSVTDTNVTNANCTVIGIPRGTYYLQAFIDSNGNGVCDKWETQGYLCTRDGTTPNYLDPTAITFDSKVGKGDLAVIYLEDADIDGDGLPDAWEYAEFGSLTAKGVELLTETKAGEFVVNTNLSGALAFQAGAQVPTADLAGEIGSRLRNMSLMALAMDVRTEGYESAAAAIEAALAPELEEGGVTIRELGMTNGKVTISLAISTTSGAESPLAKFFDANGKLTVVCEILWTPTLAQEPKVIFATDVVVGDEPVEFDISTALEKAQEEAGVDGSSAFFSARVYKK